MADELPIFDTGAQERPVFAPGFGLKGSSGPQASEPSTDLRAWRVARGWSQFEAAKQTGISLSSWIRYETRGIPELKRAKLKELLN